MELTEDQINDVFDNLDENTSEVISKLTKQWVSVKAEVLALANAWVELTTMFHDGEITADELEKRFSLFIFPTVVDAALDLQGADPTTVLVVTVADAIADERNLLVNHVPED